MESLRGKLLLANGSLFDPNFRQTVVLVVDHDEEGALGVVLNRPSPIRVAEAAPPLARLVPDEDLLFLGGPVRPEAAVVLADFLDPSQAETIAFDSVGIVASELDPEEVTGIRRIRVFAGYAGWGEEQLDDEVGRGDWIVAEPDADEIFAADPSGLWSQALRRKGGNYALLAQMPFDPSVN